MLLQLSTMEAQIDIFQRKLTQAMDSKIGEFGTKLQDIVDKSNVQIDSWTDKAQLDLYSTADEATTSFNKQVEVSSERFANTIATATKSFLALVSATEPQGKATDTTTHSQTKVDDKRDQVPHVHPLFPNVDPMTIRNFKPTNPYLEDPAQPSDTAGVPAPETTGPSYFTGNGRWPTLATV